MQTRLTPPKLDDRLMSAAPFVRGGVLADIGTDHAYLPVRLLLDGKISNAVAADINKGPLKRAAETVEKYKLSDKIKLVLTNGLCGIEKFKPEYIIIFGMGAELIVSIIDSAPWVRNPEIRLILQPMTHREDLRAYLLSHSFAIIDEAMSEAEGRIYQTICATFDGLGGEYNTAELLVGKHNIERGGELTKRYTAHLIDIYTTRKNGKIKADADTSEEDKVLTALGAID